MLALCVLGARAAVAVETGAAAALVMSCRQRCNRGCSEKDVKVRLFSMA